MKARDIMTTQVVSVHPDASTQAVAQLLLDHSISGAPVVDEQDTVVGMVSEGDLIGRAEADREARRDWWLALLAEGFALNPDFLANLPPQIRMAREVMSSPVVTVGEETDIDEIARLLIAHRIKRVPVVRDGRLVGIVSRADLLRAISAGPKSSETRHGFFADVLANLDESFLHLAHRESVAPPGPARKSDEISVSVTDFQRLVIDHEQKEAMEREAAQRMAAERRREMVAHLVTEHISDQRWQTLIRGARQAAESGQKDFMLLRFPALLCSDGGRAINAPDPDWPRTLRGEAAEIYLRWERDLKPSGFHLAAQILDFPNGFPGDAGLFLVWGG